MRNTIELPNISASVEVNDNRLSYRILQQSDKVLNLFKNRDERIIDERTGMGIFANKKPFFKEKSNLFFVRGTERQHDNDQVVCEFDSNDKAEQAFGAFYNLLRNVDREANHQANEVGVPLDGATTHLRMALFPKEFAISLQLTDCKKYPDQLLEWDRVVPPVKLSDKIKLDIAASVDHWNEHIGQAIDVMNRASGKPIPPNIRDAVVNGHKGTVKSAQIAVNIVKQMIETATLHDNDVRRDVWRLISGLRGPDMKDAPRDFDKE